MHYATLFALLRRRPFKPFRITVTTGETFDVVHPETLFLAESFLSIMVPPGENAEGDDDFTWIGLEHLVYVRPLRRAPA